MVSNYIEDTSNEDIEDTSNENIDDNNKLEKHPTEVPKDYNNIEEPAEEPTKETIEESNRPIEEVEEPIEEVEEPAAVPNKATPKSKFLNL